MFCFPLWGPSGLFNKREEYGLTVNGHIGLGGFFFIICCCFTLLPMRKMCTSWDRDFVYLLPTGSYFGALSTLYVTVLLIQPPRSQNITIYL